MKKWKIYFLILSLLSGSLLSSLFISKQEALAVESYKVPADQDNTIRRAFYNKINIQDAKFDIHYYFIAPDKYSDIEVFVWTCAFQKSGSLNIKENCGISLTKDNGYYNFHLNAGLAFQTTYSLSDSRLNIDSMFPSVLNYYHYETGNNIRRYTDANFEDGLALLGGTTLKVNNWGIKEKGSSETSTSENNNSGFNLDFGAFVNGIVNGLAQFLKPMQNSLEQVGNYFKDDPFGKIMKFLTDIPQFIISLIIPSFDDLKFRIDDVTSRLNSSFSPLLFYSHIHVDNNTGNYSSAVQSINNFSQGYSNVTISVIDLVNAVKSVPPVILYFARAFIWFAFTIWLINRVQSSIPVVFGSVYIWQKWSRKEED